MPSLASRRRSRARFEEDDDEHSSASDSSKRQKIKADHSMLDDEDTAGDSDEGVHSVANTNTRQPAAANGRAHGSEYQPGAIVRVAVDNFVTYEHAEFLPGPNLNMVIGPNGTGKSSLVCAICLGLGYHPKHLGRASNFGEFVKHGKDIATIEVELKKRPNEPANHIIRVRINKEDNSKRWWLNGQEASHKAVQQLTRNLRIQIDNLCQFLPQDKVAEFAGLTPIQLLHETLRAAAPEKMLNQQSTLQDLHKDYKKVKEQVETTTETLKGHENRQQGLQADVDRMKQREEIQKEIEELRKARTVIVYNTFRDKFRDAKQRKKEAEKRLKELEIACGPALQAVKEKEAYRNKIHPVVSQRKQALKNAEAASDQSLQAIEAQDEKIKHLADKREAEITSFQAKKAKIGKIKKAITDLEAKLKNKPPEFVAAEWNLKIRQHEATLRETAAEKREVEEELQQVDAQGRKLKAEIKKIDKDIVELDSVQGQKIALLKRINPDAATGLAYIQDHQEEFEKEVFGPPMISCSVKVDRYSDLVQSLLQRDDFMCFTTQSKNDHKKLSAIFYKELGLSATIRTCISDFASFRPPLPVEQARELGLDGYALDYLEGPEPVLAMLCAERRVHAAGVGLQDCTDAQFQQLMDGERITTWATGQTMYRITRRREYGAGAVSTTTRKIAPGSFWKDQAPDDGERARLQECRQVADSEFAELKKRFAELHVRLKSFTEGEDRARDEIKILKDQKSELQKAATLYETLGSKITIEKKDQEIAQKELGEARQRVLDIRFQEDQLVVERARSALKHKEHLTQIRDAYQALLEAQIRLIEAESDVKGLESQNESIKVRLQEVKAGIDTAKTELDTFRERAKVAQDDVQKAIADEMSSLERLNEVCAGKTLEDIDGDIDAKNASLEVMHRVDPQVLRQFEKRARDIQDLGRRKEELTHKLESLSGQIEELMRVWVPQVDALVARINEAFSHNFEQISCAGEVGVHKDEDFEQWAIEIKVKFRENETLQQLNQHRQSGGERAVSTIFYLMALQSMAQAPFRVVDEINQGMDPRNERMVHERMVEIACREHTSQYFLITPKLLTGLRYDPRMRVLCIASGEHVPPDGRRLDFGRLVRIQRAVRAGA
ncbi:Structural maintenance of chromosomes protein 5 [Diatrype stigma]|uniref:Structural maintenance of chromosomes protein 5 n=1 Tax=Diatrype stigma TaxID=117547 RepID=A0AAN9YW43_9PEZI